MTEVSIREFQRNAGRYMKSLPIALTKYNRTIAIVLTKEDAKQYIKKKDK